MPYMSVRQAALALGVSDEALLDWMDRRLVATESGPGGVRRLPDTSVAAVLARLPSRSDEHGLTEDQVEAILVREAGHPGKDRYSASRGTSTSRRATPWETVKGIVSAVLEWHWH